MAPPPRWQTQPADPSSKYALITPHATTPDAQKHDADSDGHPGVAQHVVPGNATESHVAGGGGDDDIEAMQKQPVPFG